jgi:hypothetical protein
MNINFFDNQLDNYFTKYNENKNEIDKHIEYINYYETHINYFIIIKTEIDKIINNIQDIFIKEYINNYSNDLYTKLNNYRTMNDTTEGTILLYKYYISCYEHNINNSKQNIETIQQNIYEINKQKKRYIRWSNNNKDYNKLFEINLNNILDN